MSQENVDLERRSFEAFNARDPEKFLAPVYTIEVDEWRDLGDVVLARFHARGHAAASDTPLVEPGWHLTHWRDGKCLWWTVCRSEAEALEAVRRIYDAAARHERRPRTTSTPRTSSGTSRTGAPER